MATQYNHSAVEKKWRKNWQEHPINVNDGKKPKYYCLDMFPYPSEQVCMWDIGEDMLFQMYGVDIRS